MVTQVDQTQRGGGGENYLLPFRVFLNVVLQVLGSLLKQGRFHKAVNYLGDNENLARTGKYNLALSL